MKPFLKTPSDPKELTVPDSRPFGEIWMDQHATLGGQRSPTNRLTVPNQDIPYYDGPIPTRGFLGNSPMFKLLDGTVIDLKTCKIVYDPNTKWRAQGYWNDPNSTAKKPNANNEWGRTESIESMLKNVDNLNGLNSDPNLSPESVKYWKKAQEESQKLEQNLTDEQKDLLDALNSGKMFPLTKLVEEK